MSLRDRILTRQGAEAITAPSAIIAAGVGAAGGILLGAPLALAGLVGLAAYGLRVAMRIPRERKGPDIEPRRLGEPWAGFVREALDAQLRYQRAVGNADAGAIRERMVDIGGRVDDGVDECWRIASRGHELYLALSQLEPLRDLRARLQSLTRAGAGGVNDRVADSLRAQIASTERILRVAEDTAERLRLLDARLDEAVARAVELSLRAGDVVELGGLGSDVDSLVQDMEALRQALEEMSRSTPQVS